MKVQKLIFCLAGALLAIVAFVVAITVFKNEISDFFAVLKEKFEEKKNGFRGEFSDYADM